MRAALRPNVERPSRFATAGFDAHLRNGEKPLNVAVVPLQQAVIATPFPCADKSRCGEMLR
jgi:hypothetical protein